MGSAGVYKVQMTSQERGKRQPYWLGALSLGLAFDSRTCFPLISVYATFKKASKNYFSGFVVLRQIKQNILKGERILQLMIWVCGIDNTIFCVCGYAGFFSPVRASPPIKKNKQRKYIQMIY